MSDAEERRRRAEQLLREMSPCPGGLLCVSPDAWWVYVVECSDGTLYTGIAKSVEARLAEHNAGKGAKYTRGRGPVRLLASRLVPSKGDALRLEAFIKRQPRDAKVGLLRDHMVEETDEEDR